MFVFSKHQFAHLLHIHADKFGENMLDLGMLF